MKIRVDKDEWEELKKRVESLESSHHYDSQYYMSLSDQLQGLMEDFFRDKVQTYMVKRDKDMIIAELKSKAIDNMFKGEEEE